VTAGRGRLPQGAARSAKTRKAFVLRSGQHARGAAKLQGLAVYEHRGSASLLDAAGAPDRVVVAGLLHDTLEKTEIVRDQLEASFGKRIKPVGRSPCRGPERYAGYAKSKARSGNNRSRPRARSADDFPPTRSRRSADRAAAGSRANSAATVRLRSRFARRPRRLSHIPACLSLPEEKRAQSPIVVSSGPVGKARAGASSVGILLMARLRE